MVPSSDIEGLMSISTDLVDFFSLLNGMADFFLTFPLDLIFLLLIV